MVETHPFANSSNIRSSDPLFEKSQNQLWTVNDVAEFLQTKPKTVRDWVYKKRIPFHKINGLLRFVAEEIKNWALQKGVPNGN